jgi:hypothetical protein
MCREDNGGGVGGAHTWPIAARGMAERGKSECHRKFFYAIISGKLSKQALVENDLNLKGSNNLLRFIFSF